MLVFAFCTLISNEGVVRALNPPVGRLAALIQTAGRWGCPPFITVPDNRASQSGGKTSRSLHNLWVQVEVSQLTGVEH